MKIMVSACLAGENCKYARSNEQSASPCLHERPFDECRDTEYEVRGNGGNNRNEKVLQLMQKNEVITVCPEQMGGLPDLDQIILVYCRSGNRSRQASQKLFDMGYTNVYEFGGILDWTGEIVTDDTADETAPERQPALSHSDQEDNV